MAEFFNDQHREAYIEGLKNERVGYEARIEHAKADDDSTAAKRYQRRIDQVDAELKRLGEDVAEPSKPKASRGAAKPKAAKDAAKDDETPAEGAEDES